MTTPLPVHVVDDDEAVRTSLHFALEATGHDVSSYDDARDFLERGCNQLGILVCDVRMPGMNGIELARMVKRDNPDMPIIMVTGHADAMLRADATSAGADVMLEKPVELGKLIVEIRRLTAEAA
jgi:two-component system response regulator FixJ